MNIIEQLHKLITPKVLELVKHYTGDDESKGHLLTSIYGILGARLSDSSAVERVESLINKEADASDNGAKLLDALLQDDKGNSQVSLLTSELAKEHDLPESTTSAVLATATPLVLKEFKGLAGDISISAYLKSKLEDLAGFLPSWATALLPAGLLAGVAGFAGSVAGGAKDAVSGLASGVGNLAGGVADGAKNATGAVVSGAKDVASGAKDAVGSVASSASSVASNVGHEVAETAKKGGGFLKSLLPIIGLLILAGLIWLLLRSCQDTTTPVAKPVVNSSGTTAQEAQATTAPADAKPATLSFATDETGNAIYTCKGQAGGEGVFASIRTALSGVFGADKCELNTSAEHADTLPVAEHLPAIFGLMKGVPNASLNISDKEIHLNSTDPEALKKLIDGVKGVVGADYVVDAEPQLDADTAVNTSLESAKTALEGLNDTATAEDVIKALNMQIINFATASHAVPDANKAILDTAATKLASLPEARLKITGHTDSQGNHASNQKLSERRANAVREYLVSKGVPAERLEVFGASSDEPVASNATEQGRFQNRRIEFTLIEEDGTVTSVGNADNSQAVADAQAKSEDKADDTTEAKADAPTENK
ncbi:MAG: OmpA family protein [Moraxella sp.]|nr:OmpA family protein [Moraxella sp.]